MTTTISEYNYETKNLDNVKMIIKSEKLNKEITVFINLYKMFPTLRNEALNNVSIDLIMAILHDIYYVSEFQFFTNDEYLKEFNHIYALDKLFSIEIQKA